MWSMMLRVIVLQTVFTRPWTLSILRTNCADRANHVRIVSAAKPFVYQCDDSDRHVKTIRLY